MIYFVRHGQTDDNANGNLLTGWSATPLNERGFAQARETAAALKDIKFDVCFCSVLFLIAKIILGINSKTTKIKPI